MSTVVRFKLLPPEYGSACSEDGLSEFGIEYSSARCAAVSGGRAEVFWSGSGLYPSTE